MIADMYKRREKLAYIAFITLVAIGAGFLFYTGADSVEQWMEAVAFLMPALMMLGVGIGSRSKYKKVKGISIPRSSRNILEIDHIIFKKDASWMPKMLVFEKNGSFLGSFHLTNVPWWARLFILLRSSSFTFLPVEIAFTSNKGDVVFTCRRRGFKQSIVEIYNTQGDFTGAYIQEEIKSVFTIKGELKDREGKCLLQVKSSGFTGNFTLYDRDGLLWARFYNGRFPHEHTEIFRDVYNDMVGMTNRIPENHKILLLGMVGYLFMNRNNRD
ncbi:hypothetical protein AS034_12635 [[Bacillus] enclensis]|uniref:Uncharacterized protein n=1 Tax=[Bacillus] enclensis TaxID=1402860 RepID=A0A0V8HKP6_9BACI|nr:hypothetical protein [[Bacillus] enclensis]KSU62935.1 hypothetical protein AS034_12635 [[Bacillus] enclensis]SCC11804.1 hypothetical protein GA0061094_2614 [[Bacillus] enclensis]